MKYDYKPIAEIVWFAFVAALVYTATVIAEWNPDSFTEWRTYLPALGAGAGRAALGAIMPRIGKLFGLG